MCMGWREFLALVPRGSRFGCPLFTRDRRRSCNVNTAWTREACCCGMSMSNVASLGAKSPCMGTPIIPGTTQGTSEAHCQPADLIGSETGDPHRRQRAAPGIGQFSGFEGVRAADVGEGPLGNLIGAKLCSGNTGMPMAVIVNPYAG